MDQIASLNASLDEGASVQATEQGRPPRALSVAVYAAVETLYYVDQLREIGNKEISVV